MNILKFKDGYIGNPRLVYCGRPSKDEYYCEQLLIGLGNPYSWRNSKKAKFKAKSLAESLSEYRKWLWKLICCYRGRNLDQRNYVDRDKQMCAIANYGLAIWDGKSQGTAANILRVQRTKVILA